LACEQTQIIGSTRMKSPFNSLSRVTQARSILLSLSSGIIDMLGTHTT